jgi:glycine cleavage system H lipoate-binding protein
MSAGLLAYRLCDRDFDCDSCPLDAALRGASLPAGSPLRPPGAAPFEAPPDRLYDRRHVWVQRRARRREGGRSGDRSRVRLGLDAFAVALVWPITGVVWRAPEGPLAAGSALCDLELTGGHLPVVTPVSGRLLARNRGLEADASLLADSPYDEGWLVELEEAPAAGGEVREGGGGLAGAAEAAERSRLDLRRFRRRAALFLLEGSEAAGPTLADGGQVLTDLRVILGPGRYLELVRDLLT